MWEFGFLWVWMGTRVVSLILSLSRDPVTPFFSCFIWFIFQLSLHNYWFCLSFPGFFPFLCWFFVPTFALANKMFALHFFFLSCLVWLKFFLSRKQYFYSNSNWIKYCLWSPPSHPIPCFFSCSLLLWWIHTVLYSKGKYTPYWSTFPSFIS